MTERARIEAVLFDWDGTIVDSAELSYRCYERLFASYGLPFGRREFERTYSPNWQRTYLEVGLPAAHWTEADERWLAFYAEERNGLVSGALAALSELRESGVRLGVVSSGERSRVADEIVQLGLEGFFEALVCGTDVECKKPHPEGLHTALRQLALGPAAAAYVGDSPEDVEMARAAGVFAVGVPGGFPNRERLRASCPDLLASSLSEAVQTLLMRSS
jgi:HAD superfamily hydrolase (TIGR01509 family)